MKKKYVVFILALVVVWAAQLGVKYWVFYRIQRSMKTEVRGTLIPSLWKPEFVVHNASLHWIGKIRVVSGDVWVGYRLLNSFLDRKLRIQIRSENAVIYLEGGWAGLYPSGQIPLNHFKADVSLENGSLKEIHEVEADSPVFHFGLKPEAQKRSFQ